MKFDWANGLTDEEWATALAGGDTRAPVMPPADVQAMFVGSSGAAAFEEPRIFWSEVRETLAKDGAPLTAQSKLLDVGVGWGRLYRWVLRDFPAENLIGVDVDPHAVSMCKQAMPFGAFIHVIPNQHYPFSADEFDFAFLYSVFSHLSEKSALQTLSFIKRVLKPGGYIALTTLIDAHIDVWHRQSTEDNAYGRALSKASFDRDRWWSMAAEGKHLYVPTGGGDISRPEEMYGEAVVPESWWAALPDFELVRFAQGIGLPQALVILKKK